ncbi:MAG: DUF1003 domain-containing protein [Nanoarchaeota archaeon]
MVISKHPAHDRRQLNIGQQMADTLANWVGSWFFIFFYLIFVSLWIVLNLVLTLNYGNDILHDPYPFIFLNLLLAFLTALQAPIILMSQNRATERDRLRADYDYQVNRKSEREIEILRKQLDAIERKLR